MGIQFSLDRLVRDAKTLDLTYAAWANESDDARRARMERNIDFLLHMMGGYLQTAKGDWREAFPGPQRAMIYDHKLQSELERGSAPKCTCSIDGTTFCKANATPYCKANPS